MLSPDQSPVHRLVSTWWDTPPPATCTTGIRRFSLFLAATEEIVLNQSQGKIYDPLADNRFRWAAQWLDIGDRSIRVIDPSIQLAAQFIFAPPRLSSRQHLAAND